MNQLTNFGLGLLLGVVGLYGAMHFTVVQAKDGFHVVPKLSPKLENPYLDVRGFRLQNWQKHQTLALSIVKADKGYLLQSDPTLLTFHENVRSVLSRYNITTQSTSQTISQADSQNSVASLPMLNR